MLHDGGGHRIVTSSPSSPLSSSLSRAWHALIVLVVFASLAAQLIRVFAGVPGYSNGPPASTLIRVVRFFSFFTIQSNVLAMVSAALLVARPDRDGPAWRVLRIGALVGVTVTFVVYFVALRPMVQLRGVPFFTNLGFHYVAPLMTVGGWLLFGPRPRIDRTSLLKHLAWPVAYLAYVLAFGAATGWYPYPFFNVTRIGYARTLLSALVITLLLLTVGAIYYALDRKLARTHFAGK
jgi:hypothetical protein